MNGKRLVQMKGAKMNKISSSYIKLPTSGSTEKPSRAQSYKNFKTHDTITFSGVNVSSHNKKIHGEVVAFLDTFIYRNLKSIANSEITEVPELLTREVAPNKPMIDLILENLGDKTQHSNVNEKIKTLSAKIKNSGVKDLSLLSHDAKNARVEYLKSLNHEDYCLKKLNLDPALIKQEDKNAILRAKINPHVSEDDYNKLLKEGVEDNINWDTINGKEDDQIHAQSLKNNTVKAKTQNILSAVSGFFNKIFNNK